MTDRETTAPLPLDDFVANVEGMQAGLSEMMAAGLRLQMLMIEDAQNMLDELGTMLEAANQSQKHPDRVAGD